MQVYTLMSNHHYMNSSGLSIHVYINRVYKQTKQKLNAQLASQSQARSYKEPVSMLEACYVVHASSPQSVTTPYINYAWNCFVHCLLFMNAFRNIGQISHGWSFQCLEKLTGLTRPKCCYDVLPLCPSFFSPQFKFHRSHLPHS